MTLSFGSGGSYKKPRVSGAIRGGLPRSAACSESGIFRSSRPDTGPAREKRKEYKANESRRAPQSRPKAAELKNPPERGGVIAQLQLG